MGDPRKLMVRQLPWSVRDKELLHVFDGIGRVEEAKVIMDREDASRSRGFGFVTYASATDAQRAVQELDGSSLEGRQIKVALASERKGGAAPRGRYVYSADDSLLPTSDKLTPANQAERKRRKQQQEHPPQGTQSWERQRHGAK